uniref:Cytochrome P450 family 2 subfamily U member 1 n=1 Tax=Pseudonaja textilis TaxID=8673 RepID=A0A670XQ18_PSETE
AKLSMFGFVTTIFLLQKLSSLTACPEWDSRFPPGPTPWFFLGNLLQKDALPVYKTYPKLAKKYGPVFTIWLGPKPLVVVCGYEAVKDALITHSEEFGGRSPVPILDEVTKGYGKWKVLRRFTLTTLRNFGMGKKSMAERMSEEACCLVEKISSFEVPTIAAAVSNVMCAVVFGKRFSYDDKIFIEILEILKIIFYINLISRHCTLLILAVTDCTKICDYVRTRVESHKKTLDPDNPRDFIDCFLIKLEKERNSNVICMEDLVMTVFELLIAGTDSTANAIAYGIILLARFPEVQGIWHQPLCAMPATNTVPLPSHAMPCRLGTTVLPLWASVHFDPLCWDNPRTFDPAHFLDKNGEFQKKDAYLPFSAGKRVCPGESLANMEIFISFTNLLQNFTFELTMDPKEIDLENFETMSNIRIYSNIKI